MLDRMRHARSARRLPGPMADERPAMPAPLELGLIVNLSEKVEDSFRQVADVGLRTCQLCCWQPDILSPALAALVRDAVARTGIEVSSFWAGHRGEAAWNFIKGPSTIGLVPAATRSVRLADYKRMAGFARAIGAPSMTTHVGFIPEDPSHPDYVAVVAALKDLAATCAAEGIEFWFETGQETPVVLLRTIEDIGAANLGINLDPANLILYGKGNPIDALEVFGRWVKGLHAKDGSYPTNGRELGHEQAIGRGKVDFARLIPDLKKHGFNGRVTIEREISGPQQRTDILAAIAVLEPLL